MILQTGNEWGANRWLNMTVDECMRTREFECRLAGGDKYEPSPIVRLARAYLVL